ncbi:peptidoglycan DD-metalloendopeptidase family protein [Phaeovulum sp.]|uniref:peptidoglycan DD-metalloendopeptidase family protein n=1 Tax=Phaeovulum sp. TaxID=2934796 RepID=UPI0035621A25
MPFHCSGPRRVSITAAALLALAGCNDQGNFDFDLRNLGNTGIDTSAAVQQAVNPRPEPDARGVISYPTYQVVVAKRGDSVAAIAARIGVGSAELASYNALKPDTILNGGEVLALPSRVAETTGTTAAPGRIDITELASGAIDRATATGATTGPATATATTTSEPIQHKVMRGETAYSIARYYSIDVRSLAEWNGLPSDMSVREGQYLMIPTPAPVVRTSAAAPVTTTAPGQGSPTPVPPSAALPLPSDNPPAAATAVATPPAADLGATRTATTASQLAMPVTGSIIRPYAKGSNDGIDISAAAGTSVRAAEAGTVAAITRDTDGVTVLVIRLDSGLLTVYQFIDSATVAKGDRVTRGQVIAKVRAGTPSFLHFEVRDGFDSLDPMPYLQ